MRSRLFALLARIVTTHPLVVITAGLAAVLASALLVPRLTLKASRFDLVPAGEPAVTAYQRFNDEFGSLNSVFVVLSGPAGACRPFLDRVAHRLRAASDLTSSVQFRVDLERFREQGLQLLDRPRLESIERDIGNLSPLVVALSEEPSCRRFVAHVAEELEEPGGPAPPVHELISSMRFVQGALHYLAQRLQAATEPHGRTRRPGQVFPELALEPDRDKRAILDELGYLCSRDGKRYLLIISPACDLDTSSKTRAFLARLDDQLRTVGRDFAAVSWQVGGGSIGDLEEERTIESDLSTTSGVAYAVVFGLSALAFGSLFLAAAAGVILAVSLLWTSAATVLLIGHLNLISSVFLAILVGLGMDFAIYLLTLYQDARAKTAGDDAVGEAFRTAIVLGGPGMLTGALTTAAAFYSLLLHRFPAFRELGTIAGTGVLLAWVAMTTLLPAAVVLRERWFPVASSPGRDPRSLKLGRLLVAFVRPRRLLIGASGAALVIAVAAGLRAPFEYNLSNLQASGAKSVEVERILKDDFGLSTDFNVVLCRSLAAARQVVARAKASPAIGVVDSPSDLAVEEGTSLDPAVGRIASLARGMPPIPATSSAVDLAALSSALQRLPTALKRPRSLARMSSSTGLESAIDGVEAKARQVVGLLTRIPAPAATEVVAEVGQRMACEVALLISTLRKADRTRAYTLSTLPADVRSRYVGSSGSVAVYVSPASDLSRRKDARAFVDQSEALVRCPGVKGVAGIPIIVFRMIEMIRAGFKQAALLALLAVMLVVHADFSRLSLTAVALAPMVCGSAWMAGLLGLAGRTWNPLNSLGIPVILGVGIAFGVNLLHRLRKEKERSVAVAGTGRAIVYSASTAMAGFGSLGLAAHRGLGSFGVTLAVGVAATMIACLALVPSLVDPADRE